MSQKLNDYNLSKPRPILGKGGPGTGKSLAFASFPKPYIISTDRKVAAIKAYYPNSDIEFDMFDTFWDVYLKLEELQEHCPHGTVMVDTLTSLGQLAIAHSMQFRPVERAGDAKNKLGRAKGELMLTELEDFGAEAQGLYQVINKLKIISNRWNCWTILIAHVLTIESKNTMKGTTTYEKTILTGGKKVAAGIPGDFDEVYHFEVRAGFSANDDVKYICRTHHNGDDFAKTSLPLPKEIDFTGKNFYEEIKKHL